MTARAKKRTTPQPFAHAEDLAPAYRELSTAIAALGDLQGRTCPLPHPENLRSIPSLTPPTIWLEADAHIAAWQRVGEAARRVHVAVHGRKDAQGWNGFKRKAARAS